MHCDFNRGGIVDPFTLPDGTFWTFGQVGEAEDVLNGAGHSHFGISLLFICMNHRLGFRKQGHQALDGPISDVDNPVWLGTTARSLVKTTTGLFVPRVERDGGKIGTNRQAIMFHALQNKKPHPWDGERGDQSLLG